MSRLAAAVRGVRIAMRAARLLATDPQLPKTLRLLFVIGCIQIPCLPTDEIALAIALLWLFIWHRPALTRAVSAARTSIDTKEHTMSVRKLAVVSAAVAAALAVVVSLAVGAVPAFAAGHPHHSAAQQLHSLERAIVTGATVGIDHVTYAAEPVSPQPGPDRAVCVRNAPRPGHVPPALEIGATGLTWQYVTAGEARYFHVSRCSVVLVGFNRHGQDADFILTPSLRVVGRS